MNRNRHGVPPARFSELANPTGLAEPALIEAPWGMHKDVRGNPNAPPAAPDETIEMTIVKYNGAQWVQPVDPQR